MALSGPVAGRVGGADKFCEAASCHTTQLEAATGSGDNESGSFGVGSGAVRIAGSDVVVSPVGGESLQKDEHPFVSYFGWNWDNCRELWCAYKRQNTVTLGNNTNNRLEASWGQLKEWVDSFMAVDECFASIMYYQSLQEKRFISEVYKNVNVHHPAYDDEMTLVANLVSEHACEFIHGQYSYALGAAEYTNYEAFPGVYVVKSTCKDDDALDELNAEYSVTVRSWTC
ncbi:unnamed protein product [Phytophthora fragariaefolia]|uniref:Unnamed protein product n=1 Tax=Phytophthora fragariaefolia TaxID=1490495 RepID=A0A9W6XU61_9STRA|nr:unnamed protein product [Phytophthora fragariaefolia]